MATPPPPGHPALPPLQPRALSPSGAAARRGLVCLLRNNKNPNSKTPTQPCKGGHTTLGFPLWNLLRIFNSKSQRGSLKPCERVRRAPATAPWPRLLGPAGAPRRPDFCTISLQPAYKHLGRCAKSGKPQFPPCPLCPPPPLLLPGGVAPTQDTGLQLLAMP